MVEDAEVIVATVPDSISTVMATNDDDCTPPELNSKLTKPGENDAATEALTAEAKATASDQGTSPVIPTAAKLNPNPTKPTANNAVIDATLMVEDSEVMVATVPDSIPTVMATSDHGGTVSQGEVSQPPSVDQMLLDLKRKIAKAAENKSPDATSEGSVKPAMVSLSALSAMSPSPGPKADEYQPATQYTRSPGPTPDKNRPTARSTPSPDPKKKRTPLSAGADESLMHSDRNFDALVGMDSLSHWTLRRYPKYTQAYLEHAWDAHVEICPPCQSPTIQNQHGEEEKWCQLPSHGPVAGCSLGFRYFQAQDYLLHWQKYTALRLVCCPQRRQSYPW
jgi:hypothetical protein